MSKVVSFLNKQKFVILFVVIIGIIVFLPVMINPDNFLIINNDTAAHLKVFEAMKDGNVNTAYLGQKITGYLMIWSEKVTRVNIETLFMIFNFGCLFLGGLFIGILVMIITKNKFIAMITVPTMIFGVGATMHLFESGTIFNLIEYLILLPIGIGLVFVCISKRKYWLIPIIIIMGVLLFFFHPSFGSGVKYLIRSTSYSESTISIIEATVTFFGIANMIALLFCLFIYFKDRMKERASMKVVIATLITVLSIAMYICSALGITSFPSRFAINASLLIGIALCLWLGMTVSKKNNKIVNCSLISLVAIGIVPNLINWFNWSSLYNPERGAF